MTAQCRTEDDVIRLAAKRPNRPDVLVQIARSDKWMHRARVRLTLVLNPQTPPEVASPRASWITGACLPVDGAQGRSLI